MDNRILLVLVTIMLVAVLGMMLLEKAPENSPGEKISDSINEVTEEIKDEIDDNTTSRP